MPFDCNMARRRKESDAFSAENASGGRGEFSELLLKYQIPLTRDHRGVYCLQFSFDGKHLAVGCGSGFVEIYESQTGKLLFTFKKPMYVNYPVMCLRYNPCTDDGTLYAATAKGLVLACNLENEGMKEILTEKDNEINALDFSLDGFNFATAGRDLEIRIYDSTTGQLDHSYHGYHPLTYSSLDFKGHSQRVFALRYHPRNNYIFLTGGWDNCVKIWDSRTRDGVERTIAGPHICGDSLDLKGFEILTGSWKSQDALQIWEYTSSELMKNVPFSRENAGEFIYCAQFCDRDVVMAGGSGTNSIKAINFKTEQCLGELHFEKPVQALDTVNGGRMFACGGMNSSIKIGSLQ